MQRKLRPRFSIERAIAEIASRQNGLITRTQLLALGLGPGAIEYRLRAGRLTRLHGGVYRLSGLGPPTLAVRALAAVLACRGDGVASHRTAASLWQLLTFGEGGLIEVTVPRGGPESRPGIVVHRSRSLLRGETSSCAGVPVTTPARTILDLAATVTGRQVEQAYATARRRSLVRDSHLLQLLRRHPGRPGTPLLRRLLSTSEGPALSRSEAEERFLTLIRDTGLPPPETNVRLGPFEVDFLWRRERMIVEIDGFAFHSSRASFEADRARDAELQAEGWRVMRVTWGQLVEESRTVLTRIERALALDD